MLTHERREMLVLLRASFFCRMSKAFDTVQNQTAKN